MEETSEKKNFLHEIAEELVNDPDWELPPEERFFLAYNLSWSLLAL